MLNININSALGATEFQAEEEGVWMQKQKYLFNC